jgi:hypothetical protein
LLDRLGGEGLGDRGRKHRDVRVCFGIEEEGKDELFTDVL